MNFSSDLYYYSDLLSIEQSFKKKGVNIAMHQRLGISDQGIKAAYVLTAEIERL